MALSACADDSQTRLAAEWGCGPVEGVGSLNGDNPPAWVLIGEFTETSEAPAAVADIACNLATTGRKLYVGVSEYLGGATDAETNMLARLDAMIAKGAPIVVDRIGGDDHPYAVRDKTASEKAWAAAISMKVQAAGASQALLFVSRADAIAKPIPPSGDRFAGYSPMPTFLDGAVVSLEVAANPMTGATGPAIRIHREMKDGFHGQLALRSLTRPMVAVMMPEGRTSSGVVSIFPPSEDQLAAEEKRRADAILHEAQERIQRLLDAGSMNVILDTDTLRDHLDEDLPQFEAE